MCVVIQPVSSPVGFSPGSSIPGCFMNFSWRELSTPWSPSLLPQGRVSLAPHGWTNTAGPSGERPYPPPSHNLPCSLHSPCTVCGTPAPLADVYPAPLRLPLGGWSNSLPQVCSPSAAGVGLLKEKITHIWWERFIPLPHPLPAPLLLQFSPCTSFCPGQSHMPWSLASGLSWHHWELFEGSIYKLAHSGCSAQ